jgi:hypothetical protein
MGAERERTYRRLWWVRIAVGVAFGTGIVIGFVPNDGARLIGLVLCLAASYTFPFALLGMRRNRPGGMDVPGKAPFRGGDDPGQ